MNFGGFYYSHAKTVWLLVYIIYFSFVLELPALDLVDAASGAAHGEFFVVWCNGGFTNTDTLRSN